MTETSEFSQKRPLFRLGQIVATPGAIQALVDAGKTHDEFITRHVTGDWGSLPPEDIQENEFSLKRGLRLFSRYVLDTGTILWVITEADRSVTTLLLPQEY